MKKPGRPRAYCPELYHGVGDKPMDERSWRMAKLSNEWLRKPLVPSFYTTVISIIDRLRSREPRYRLRLIASKHVERLREAA
jgi:hypothetical protein